MKTNLFYGLLLAIAVVLVGCKETPEVPPTPIDKPDFVIAVNNITDVSVEFTITPEDEQMTYVAMMTTKEYFDEFEDDHAYIMDDLAWFENVAFEEGVELCQYLERILKKGVISDTQDKLDPATEYVVYAFGLTKDGDVITSLYKECFTTLATELKPISFDIEVSDIGYDTANVSVTPSDDKAIYFVNVFSYEDYAYYGGDESAFAEHLTQLRNYYYNLGATADQMVANLGFVGEKSLKVEKLKSGTKYMAYAIGIDERFIANSEATIVEFETPAVEASDLTFEVEITNIDYDHIEGRVIPSNDEESYICSIQYASALEWSESEEAFADSIIEDIAAWGDIEDSLRKGVMSLNGVTGLQPETNYIVVCFGYDGARTTAPHIAHFTTDVASGDPDELVVTFEVSEITHNSATVTSFPSVGAYYFTFYTDAENFNSLVEEYGSVDACVSYLADTEIDYGADYFGSSRAEYLYDLGASLGMDKMLYNQLEPSTDYVAYAIAVDIMTGELASDKGFVSDVFRTLEKVVSDATVTIELGNYYDGSALAELDPARFLNCKGYVVLPYTVTAGDSASAWYTGFYDGDFTEWGCTDDDIYAELVTYGWEYGSTLVSENRQSGVAVLSYDRPYTFLGIAKDSAGVYGVGFIEVVTLTREGVSPAEEFLAAHPAAQPAGAARFNSVKR